MTPIHFISLENQSILQQLQLEEALLRTDERNFCIINRKAPPAIVMGISGKPEALLDLKELKKDPIPVIQRFSGGGTVLVDENTLFISFIFSKNALPLHPFPEPILRWTAELYQSAWDIPGFALSENDYSIGDKKCGGNAQYIQKNRWLHHTTFLWNYSEEKMSRYLLMPEKRPKYRQSRSHQDFLCRMKDHAPSPEFLISSLLNRLNVKPLYIEPFDPQALQFEEHRKTTRQLSDF